jgi:hypothetical protein
MRNDPAAAYVRVLFYHFVANAESLGSRSTAYKILIRLMEKP